MKIETVDYTASDAGERLARSLRETGFAVLANHPIQPDRIDEAYALWGGFFASDSKSDYLRDYEKQDGYFPFKSEHAKDAKKKDLKEFYHVYPWGRVPEDLEAVTRQLYADLTAIGVELLSWLDQQMPDEISATLSMPLQEMMQGDTCDGGPRVEVEISGGLGTRIVCLVLTQLDGAPRKQAFVILDDGDKERVMAVTRRDATANKFKA